MLVKGIHRRLPLIRGRQHRPLRYRLARPQMSGIIKGKALG